ncbi:polysaccharide deacetylase [Amycolatopsis sp. SID8362]|uniref:polysaccharide deacetylase family protein n=1 Tax=Amycolatopsis sp. SID8362 TaxID=2690346 RepID=UPI00136D1335|nr:polysaccharide deacetylase [Amycolatopsis sp. SID8362]NBH08765.1 polysaccharide deacetylase family protein [Amycolatopsis sp. SID8362]NED45458.1 polysaccharide deacetylase [Amycolatopsis sp. SID8362]
MTEQPWQWDEATWRGHVEHVRAGRPLRPASWPGGAKVAVALSFDSDHETPALRDGEVLPGKLAQGEYGARVGVPRILKLLQRHNAPASFFVPAVSALLHDGEVKSYVDAGHEVALHGWIHERNTALTETEERDLAFRAADVLERLAGTRPVGIRTPSWDFSAHTLAITRELGLTYDSSLMADDDCYELLEHGEPTGIVELPVEWIRDDAPYFMMDRFASLRPYTPPRGVLSIWRDEFDAAYAEGGIFQLTLHPHIIGHRSRLATLAELLDHIDGHDGVWYATHAQIVDHVRQEQP